MKLLETLMPSAVEEMKAAGDSTTHNSSIVTFSLPKELKSISQEMSFDVRLADEYDNEVKIENPRLQVKGTQGFLALDGLKYANTEYKVAMRIKARIAMEMWSPFTNVSFTTKPIAPVKVPETCRNCFNVMDNNNVFVYWAAVPRKYHNADGFAYRVRIFNEQGIELIRRNLSETSMVLRRDLKAENLSIEIYTVNVKGISEKFISLFVPLQQLQSNKNTLKIHKELIDGEYKISWKPSDALDIENFTIISCRQRNDRSNQCDGPINFVYLKADANEYTEEANFSKQFGIAVNVRNKSVVQGFEWAACTAAKQNGNLISFFFEVSREINFWLLLIRSEIGQIHSLWSNVITDHSITLQWELNCVDEPIVAGYNITYCPVESSNHCTEPMLWTITMGNELRQFEIPNLKSYKHYKISVALLSHLRHGVYKTPIYVRTLESGENHFHYSNTITMNLKLTKFLPFTAPTAPRNLKYLNIQQHSVDLEWKIPHEVNGEAMTYQLWYNDHKININDNNTMNETFAYKLQELEAYTNYTITVVACTSFCSDSNDNLKLRTAMGEPGMMLQPKLESLDENKVLISWEAPTFAGGNLDYFQLKTISPSDGGEAKIYRVNGRARSCVIKSLKCDNEKIDFAIRSVNVEYPSMMVMEREAIECFDFREPIEGEVAGQFYGEWSQTSIFYCQVHFSMTMAGIIFLLLVALIASIFMLVGLYQKYKTMKDIKIIWPKGLYPNSPSSSPSKKENISDATKDLDLIRDHVLTDIEEEVEEREKFITPTGEELVIVVPEKPAADQRESAKSELFLPFICNPKTNEIFYTMPKMSVVNEKVLTTFTPTLPKSDYTQFASPRDTSSEYVKMYAPAEGPSSPVVEGYLDMTGKSPSSPPPTPITLTSPAMPKEPDYLVNEIKMFIHDSELNNNGYIGKRASVLSDAGGKKQPMIVNSNGYVGLQQK